ncbi:MAG: hypothetical protein HY665_03400 [Chloroflexi bacterium]|nr:hypothetical protein [Chloroflexota bacterium]
MIDAQSHPFVNVNLGKGLSLILQSPEAGELHYPTDRLQKGWLLRYGDDILAEEGTGFGLPLIRCGYRTVFPSRAEVVEEGEALVVDYVLNLLERVGPKGRKSITNEFFGWARESFCALHRRLPPLRKSLASLFDGARSLLNLETRFEQIKPVGTIRVTTEIQPSRLVITADLGRLERRGCSGVILGNEQGATYFDCYRDSSGVVLSGDSIGTWQKVDAAEASFIDSRHQLRFTLGRRGDAKLFRGRELKPGKLAWAGLNYVLPPRTKQFRYEIRLQRL